jgi:hypothetical protein
VLKKDADRFFENLFCSMLMQDSGADLVGPSAFYRRWKLLKSMRRYEIQGHRFKVILIEINWAQRLLAPTHQLHVAKTWVLFGPWMLSIGKAPLLLFDPLAPRLVTRQ